MSRAKEKTRGNAAVLDAAYIWWKGRRPLGWSEKAHIENPTVNCAGLNDCNLGMAVGHMAKFRG